MLGIGTLPNATIGRFDAELCDHFLLLGYHRTGITLYDLNQGSQIFYYKPADFVIICERENKFILFGRAHVFIGNYDYKTAIKTIPDSPYDYPYKYERNLYDTDSSPAKLGVEDYITGAEITRCNYELEIDYDKHCYQNNRVITGVQTLSITAKDDEKHLIAQLEFAMNDRVHINDNFLVIQRHVTPYFYVEFSKLSADSLDKYKQELKVFLKTKEKIGISLQERNSLLLQYDVTRAASEIAKAIEKSPYVPHNVPEEELEKNYRMAEAEKKRQENLQNLKFFKEELEKNR